MKLLVYLTTSGIARRIAHKGIIEGDVAVNGHFIKDHNQEVPEKSTVIFKGKIIIPPILHYMILNKPAGYVTSRVQEKITLPAVTALIDPSIKNIVKPVGRLDVNTTGLLLFTNDGALLNRLIHPRYKMQKTYLVTVSKTIDSRVIDAISSGVRVDGKVVKPDIVEQDKKSDNAVSITIHSGQYRIIRKLFEIFGYFVKKLHRISFGPLKIGPLRMGKTRRLTEKEIIALQQKNEPDRRPQKNRPKNELGNQFNNQQKNQSSDKKYPLIDKKRVKKKNF